MPSSVDPYVIAEDDGLRSRHMRELIQSEPLENGGETSVSIPKVVIQYWHDSQDVPPDVKECLASWEPLEGRGFRRIIFDDESAREFIANEFGPNHVLAFDRCGHPAMRCDYFRLCYISRYGGFYVDADDVYQGTDCESLFLNNMLKLQPLCFDIQSGTMVDTDLFVRGGGGSRSWIFYVNNNPLIAPPAHPVVQSALARSSRLLLCAPPGLGDVQSTTGPGNLSASLVKHSIETELAGIPRDFVFLSDWTEISVSRWPLSYRNDQRNWRLWEPSA